MFDVSWPPLEYPSHFDRATFTQRQEELLFFIDYLWPLEASVIEFVDVNPKTLPRLLSIAKDHEVKSIDDLRCPWSTICPHTDITDQDRSPLQREGW